MQHGWRLKLSYSNTFKNLICFQVLSGTRIFNSEFKVIKDFSSNIAYAYVPCVASLQNWCINGEIDGWTLKKVLIASFDKFKFSPYPSMHARAWSAASAPAAAYRSQEDSNLQMEMPMLRPRRLCYFWIETMQTWSEVPNKETYGSLKKRRAAIWQYWNSFLRPFPPLDSRVTL